MAKIDIWSRNAVYREVLARHQKALVRDCEFLEIRGGHARAFYARCAKNFAEREEARNVPIDITAYSGPSSYWWPTCPRDCPLYQKDANFAMSLAVGRETTPAIKARSPYVNSTRIEELQKVKSPSFDLTKLIQMCVELNICGERGALLAVPLLVRGILDHVPPIFGKQNFGEVANNYGPKSFKDSMSHLENSSRKIADSYLHLHIRAKESLPNQTQIDFSRDLDVLLQEIVRLLK